MTLGTSPHPLGAALENSAEAEACAHATRVRATLDAAVVRSWHVLLRGRRFVTTYRAGALRVLAGGYLLALVIAVASAWGMPGLGESLHIGQVHVAFLMIAGAGMAVASLKAERLFPAIPRPKEHGAQGDLTGLGDLLAQMSHELRTPLNAVIGFSEVMRHELHGPLNARYQEYAIHISESGDRMLKSSQDALAVAEAMTVLLAKTPHLPKQRISAASLLDEAWRAVGGTAMDSTGCGPLTMLVERRATIQALEHLLREAINRAAGVSAVEAVTRSSAGTQGLEVRVLGGQSGLTVASGSGPYPPAGNGGLNILLARLLVEAQGGGFVCGTDEHGIWRAEITFKDVA